MPSVSVIIPTFNRSDLLPRAIHSVLHQTVKDIEIIVVDDHSTENIPHLLSSFSVQYLKNKGRGVSAARNTGVAAASSQLIAFLDSDDEWHKEKIQQQLHYLEKNPDCVFVHTHELWLRNQKEVTQLAKHQKYGGRIFDKCTDLCIIAPSSILMKKDTFFETGGFDETFPVCEDFDLWLRISSRYDIGFIENPLTIKHAGHQDQLSLKFHSMDLWRLRALVKHIHNPLLNSEEISILHKSIKEKALILLKGARKHNNQELLIEVSEHLQKCNLE